MPRTQPLKRNKRAIKAYLNSPEIVAILEQEARAAAGGGYDIEIVHQPGRAQARIIDPDENSMYEQAYSGELVNRITPNKPNTDTPRRRRSKRKPTRKKKAT